MKNMSYGSGVSMKQWSPWRLSRLTNNIPKLLNSQLCRAGCYLHSITETDVPKLFEFTTLTEICVKWRKKESTHKLPLLTRIPWGPEARERRDDVIITGIDNTVELGSCLNGRIWISKDEAVQTRREGSRQKTWATEDDLDKTSVRRLWNEKKVIVHGVGFTRSWKRAVTHHGWWNNCK